MSRAVLQQALDALETIRRVEDLEYGSLAKSGKAVAAIRAELGKPDGWVSVSDRLPNNDDDDLCFIAYDIENGPTISELAFRVRPEVMREILTLNRVTHWMPLPKPPGVPTKA